MHRFCVCVIFLVVLGAQSKVCINSGNVVGTQLNLSECDFLVQNQIFFFLFGQKPIVETILSNTIDVFHEGPVYFQRTNELYFTTNRLGPDSTTSTGPDQYIQIHKVRLGQENPALELVTPQPDIVMANGATLSEDGKRIIFCAQGKIGIGGSIVQYNPYTNTAKTIVNNYFGNNFNSPNDVGVAHDGSIWFTDPTYGYIQGFRDIPQLGEYVWRYDVKKNLAQVVADGFEKPNGLALSHDGNTVFITDTGYFDSKPCCTANATRPRSVYAFNITYSKSGYPTVSNRRLIFTAAVGIPDGIKTDCLGNVYIATGRGISIIKDDGTPIGEIVLPNGCSNHAFAGNYLVMMAETNLYAIKWRNPCK